MWVLSVICMYVINMMSKNRMVSNLADVPKIDVEREEEYKRQIQMVEWELQTLHERKEREMVMFDCLIETMETERERLSKELFEMYGAKERE